MTKVVAIKREIEPPIKADVKPGRPKKGAKLAPLKGKARDIIAKRDRRRKEPAALAAAQLAFGEFWSIRNAYLARHGAMMIAARGLLAAKRLHRGNRAFGRWLRQSAFAVCNQPEVSAMIWLARKQASACELPARSPKHWLPRGAFAYGAAYRRIAASENGGARGDDELCASRMCCLMYLGRWHGELVGAGNGPASLCARLQPISMLEENTTTWTS